MTKNIESLKEIESEELEMLQNSNYVKYLCARTGPHISSTFIKLGENATETDVISSIFSIIYATYRGLFDDPDTKKLAAWFGKEITEQITKDSFWDSEVPELLRTISEINIFKNQRFS